MFFQDNRLVDLPLSQPFLKLMCHGDIRTTVNERIGILPSSAAEEEVMMSSYISEESEKELELDPPKLFTDESKAWYVLFLRRANHVCPALSLLGAKPCRGPHLVLIPNIKFILDLAGLPEFWAPKTFPPWTRCVACSWLSFRSCRRARPASCKTTR
jgi:hypothetical protein